MHFGSVFNNRDMPVPVSARSRAKMYAIFGKDGAHPRGTRSAGIPHAPADVMCFLIRNFATD